MRTSIVILLLSINTFASTEYYSASNQLLSKKEVILALAAGNKVYKRTEVTLSDKGSIVSVKSPKKAGK